MSRFPTYVVTMVALDLLGLSLAAGIFPPDAVTQTYAFGVTLLAAPLVAYWLVYRGGYEHFRLQRLLGREAADDDSRTRTDGRDEN
jgi:hypothetical protein